LDPLPQAIRRALGKAEPALRLAILGIGQELRGDDAAGPLLVRALAERLPKSDALLILDAGPSPESFTAPLRRFQPDLVILVDIAWMEAPPGTVRWLSPQDAGGVSALTHSLPLHVIAGYLTSELGCPVQILAIQPRTVDFAAPTSPEITTAIQRIIEEAVSN
jgi:hydrogenase 3 maturation protease